MKIEEYLINKALGSSFRVVSYDSDTKIYQVSMGKSNHPHKMDRLLRMIEGTNKNLYKRLKKKYPEYFL